MNSGWAQAAIAAAAVLCTLIGALAGVLVAAVRVSYRRGSRDAKIDDAIEKLTEIADHLDRRLTAGGLLTGPRRMDSGKAPDDDRGSSHDGGNRERVPCNLHRALCCPEKLSALSVSQRRS